MISEAQIAEVVQKVVKGYAPEQIILFGSYAAGSASEHSDLDLCILKTDSRLATVKHREVEMLLANRQFPIDLIVCDPMDVKNAMPYNAVLFAIKQSGKVIYER